MLGGIRWTEVFAPVAVAVTVFFGRPVGVIASVRLAVSLGFGVQPKGATWLQVYAILLLCGIRFTIGLLIGGLALTDPLLISKV